MMSARLLCSALVWLAGAALADDRPQPFSAQYEGQKTIALLPATARATITLRRNAQFILYTMQTTITWTVLERRFLDCSVIRIDGERLLPLEYRHVDESDGELNVQTRFDWQQMQATTRLGTHADAKTATITWPAWDPMSFQVALMALAPKRAAGDSETHHVIERGVSKEHRVTFAGAAPLLVRGRSVQAQEIVSRKQKGQVLLYLTPQPSSQLLRVAIDDVTIDLVGNSATPPPASVPPGETPTCPSGPPR
jgi:hypothetical protein